MGLFFFFAVISYIRVEFLLGLFIYSLEEIPMKKETKSRISTRNKVAETPRGLQVFSAEHERFYFIFGLEDNVYDEKIPPRVPTLTRIWSRLRGMMMQLISFVNSLPI